MSCFWEGIGQFGLIMGLVIGYLGFCAGSGWLFNRLLCEEDTDWPGIVLGSFLLYAGIAVLAGLSECGVIS